MAKRPKAIGGWTVAVILAGLWWISTPTRDNATPPAARPTAYAPSAATRDAANSPPTAQPPVTSSSGVTTLPANDQHGIINETAYTTARLRIRTEPSTAAGIVATLDRGQSVTITDISGEWRHIHIDQVRGWAHSGYLSNRAPIAEAARPASQRMEQPVQRAIAPPAALMNTGRSGQPSRDPYIGRCDCPYDRMRNGRRCGGNSAYSRPGGASPQCYF
ncbi:SH3 domain-containing protein [Aureimonas altamirensis]|uniref:SH3 domain-containing protein n=1 Tax=Aureimonas altamirensis TaxID=370622 RepID=UPI003AFAAD7F